MAAETFSEKGQPGGPEVAPVVEVYRALVDYVAVLTRAAGIAGRLCMWAPEAVALALVGSIKATAAEWNGMDRVGA